MKPAPFTYHRPAEVDEAVRLLAELHDRDESAKVLAGGQSLVPLLSMRLAAPMHIVDVGALVRHRGLERHEGAHAVLPLLRQALLNVAHPTIRNRGTVVGSLCHADPSAEMPAVLALLGGALTVRSVRGERTVRADELFTGPLETSLADDELALAAHFPTPPPRTGTSVVEVARRHGDYAVCGVVAAVTLDDTGLVTSARATYVSAGDTLAPVDLGQPVVGATPAAADWRAAGELARDGVATEDDLHASAAYRSQLVAVLTERALREAAGRAGSRPRSGVAA